MHVQQIKMHALFVLDSDMQHFNEQIKETSDYNKKLKATMVEGSVTIQDLTKRFGSKSELYKMLSVQGNYFLPSFRYCTYDFMLQICDQKKSVFEKSEVARIEIRSYKELRLRTILEQVLPHPQIESYLPDKKREVYRVDEWYVLSIVAKIEPEWFNAIVKATFERRYTVKDEPEKQFELNMSEKLKKVLIDTPFQPRKIGKARRFMRQAALGVAKPKRAQKSYRIPSLKRFKKAKTEGKLDQLVMIRDVVADANQSMSEDSEHN